MAEKKEKKTIDETFREFHLANPEIYELIKQQAKRAVRIKKKFGMKQIIEWVRWEYLFRTTEAHLVKIEGEERKLKINNNYTSRYARKLVEDFPAFKPYIEMRELKSL